MKISTILFFVTVLQFQARAKAQDLTIDMHDAKLSEVFTYIKKHSNYNFFYNESLLNKATPVSINIKNKPIKFVLDQCFEDQDISYYIVNNMIVVTEKDAPAKNPNKTVSPPKITAHFIKGIVTDEAGIPLVGASVIIKGTTMGIATTEGGRFSIKSDNENGVLVISYVGFVTKEVPFSGEMDLNIKMIPKEDKESELVVIGYGKVKKSDLTGAVSSVSSSEVTQVKGISNVAQALQGHAAGVQINQASGQPGEGMIIKIRGTNSINGGNAPLYVVDGLPLDGLSSQLNPDDIERVEILKDASSTAMYGSRGANGVILITTKKGSAGKAKVAYNGYIGVQNLRKELDIVNARQYAILQNEVVANDNASGVNATPKELPWTEGQIDSLSGKGKDWQGLVYRQALVHNHDLSISGGNEKTNYYTSLGYYDQQGIIRNSGFKRLSFRSNFRHAINDRLSVNSSFSLQNSIYTQSVYAGAEGGGGIPWTTMVMPPIQDVYDAAGNYTKFTGVQWGETNPVGISKELYNPNNSLRIIGNGGVDYGITSDLHLKINAGIDASYDRSDYYAPSNISIGQPDGIARKTYGNSSTFVNENLLSYTKTFKKHAIDAVGGVTYQSSKSQGLNGGTARGFSNDIFQDNNLAAATTAGIPSSSYSDSKLISYLGRINYIFDEKYFATVTGRYDGSSKFSPNYKYAFFPSAALAWRVSKESFMENIGVISDLKLRSSYGLSGNQAIGNYQTLSRVSNTNVIFDNDINIGYIQSALPYNNLKWETTAQLDLGVDIGFLSNRIQLTFDYYSKKTTDLLLAVQLPTSSGFSTALQNAGAVQNRGYEFQLATKNTKGAFVWNSVLNLSHNSTKVLSLGNDAQGKPITYQEIGTGGNWFPMIVGQSMQQLYGYEVKGIYQSDEEAAGNGEPTKRAGDYKFWDRDGNGVVDGGDRQTLTHLEPKFTFGFNNNMSYKNFDLSLLFIGSYGNDIVNEFRKYNLRMTGNWAPTVEAFNGRWTGPGTSNQFDKPSVNSGSSLDSYANSLWVENGSYVKLKDITLGYTFSKNLADRLHISSARLYISAQNICTITHYGGYDPEVSWSATSINGWDRGNYPASKSITVGLKLVF